MESLILIVALIVILTAQLVLAGMAFLIYKTLQEEGSLPQSVSLPFGLTKPDAPAHDGYTPNSADQTVPIDQFQPNFDKPFNIKVVDDEEDQITEEDDSTH